MLPSHSLVSSKRNVAFATVASAALVTASDASPEHTANVAATMIPATILMSSPMLRDANGRGLSLPNRSIPKPRATKENEHNPESEEPRPELGPEAFMNGSR